MIIKGFTRPFYFLELAVTVQFKLAPLFKEIELMARLNIEQSFVEIPNQFHSWFRRTLCYGTLRQKFHWKFFGIIFLITSIKCDTRNFCQKYQQNSWLDAISLKLSVNCESKYLITTTKIELFHMIVVVLFKVS